MKSNNQGKFGWIQALILPIWMGTACKSEVTQEFKPKPEESEAPLPTAEVATTSSSPLELTGRVPLLIRPGTTVTLSGNHIRPTLTLAFGGEPRLPVAVTVASDASASFVAPDNLPHGALELIAEQEGVEQKVSLFYDGGKTDYPVFAGHSGLISSSQKYYDANGILQQGTKVSETTLAPCTADGEKGCISNDLYPAANLANAVPANIKSGVTIAGVTGAYPSATYPLAGATATADLDLATFDAKVKSATNFEWFNPAGTLQTYAGDAGIVDTNIKSGVTIFGTTGTLASPPCAYSTAGTCVADTACTWTTSCALNPWHIRSGITISGTAGNIAFYKNMVGTYNRTAGTGGLAGLDIYDTIDDYNNNSTFPTSNPWTSPVPPVPGANWIMDPDNETVAVDNSCTSTEACVFKDQTTGQMWAKALGVQASGWEQAITSCENLSYGGYTDWRLPTQKELMQAYADGIWSQQGATQLTLAPNYYWSSSTVSNPTTNAWIVNLSGGNTANFGKTTTSYHAVCLRL